MTYLEEMKAATNDFERSKVVEKYTNEFAALMVAAGLEPVVGVVPTANGQVWRPYTGIPAPELVEIISAIATADPDLGDRASELHGDILNCSNYQVALERTEPDPRPPTKEEVQAALEPDPDADSSTWLCPDPVKDGGLEALAKMVTPIATLHEGKVDHITNVTLIDREGSERNEGPFVPTLVHRNEDDQVVAISGYNTRPLKEFRDHNIGVEPATIEEVAEREYNPLYGYFHHARMKLSRKVYVLTRYSTFGSSSYLEENHPAWQTESQDAEEDLEPIEPTTSTIELDEEREEQFAAVDEKVSEFVQAAGGQDELERLCRLLFAVKEDKKQTTAEFNERIKEIENSIEGMLRARDEARYQRRLPIDETTDEDAEKALDAAAGVPPEIASESPETATWDDASTNPCISEPEETPANPEENQAETDDAEEPKPAEVDFPQCSGCKGYGDGPDGGVCELCAGEGIEPAVRESDDQGMLQCARCGHLRSFWAFVKFEGGLKGHVCNVCRKV